jgi:hypothetical protein
MSFGDHATEATESRKGTVYQDETGFVGGILSIDLEAETSL